MIGLQWCPILLVGGALFREARCPISQVTHSCLCHLFNRLSLWQWHHGQFDQCQFWVQTSHHITLNVIQFLASTLRGGWSVTWDRVRTTFCWFWVCNSACNYSWIDVVWNILDWYFWWNSGCNSAVCWQNSGWTLCFVQYAQCKSFLLAQLWSKFVIFCVKCVQL